MQYKQYNRHFVELSIALMSINWDEMKEAIGALRVVQERSANVWIVGNGGSAATAGHFANDLSKMCGIKAFSVPAMVPTMLAFGNDDGWDSMFRHTIDVYLQPDDLIVAISCSGMSVNVVEAAKGIQNLIIMTGSNLENNYLARLHAKAVLCAMNDDITIQEDVHMAMCHAIAKALRE